MISRRVFAAIAAGSLALALGACGGTSEPAPAETETAGEATTEEAAEEAATEETAEETAEPEAAAEEEPAAEAPYVVTIDGVRTGKLSWDDTDVAIVTFSFTNNSEDTTSFASAVYAKVFQNGIECETTFDSSIIENDNYMTEIRPGTTIPVEMLYEISDTSDIEVEVTELFSWSDEKIAEATLSLS